ncbi:hypothetical protein [Pectobacterium zantedeschiae]|uniref:hypothetical protein n=1 Tax=Pectobacterium zantedeschiae TaxID=2034769 RepID=UPI00101D2E33|nr:hypothetical protein [Pectobacterium zantedeschiae]RYC47877.1 hypothetical protein DEH81_05810 [Pectobacterium zantedeschiae]
MKFSRIDFCFTLVVFFIFLLFLSLLYPNLLKDVKITDWLSLFVNCIIATLAFLGFYYAKDWKQTLTENKALEEGIILKYQVIEEVENSYFKFLPSMLKHQLPDNFRSGFFDDVRTETFFNVFHSIRSELDFARDSLHKVHVSLDKIVFFGWGLCGDKLAELLKVDSSLDELYTLRFQLEKLFNDFSFERNVYFDSASNFPYKKHSKITAKLSDVTVILNDFFEDPQNHKKFNYIVDKMMDIRSSSLSSVKIISNRYGKIHDLIEPKK